MTEWLSNPLGQTPSAEPEPQAPAAPGAEAGPAGDPGDEAERLLRFVQEVRRALRGHLDQLEQAAGRPGSPAEQPVGDLLSRGLLHGILEACQEELGILEAQAQAWVVFLASMSAGEPEAPALAALQACMLEMETAQAQYGVRLARFAEAQAHFCRVMSQALDRGETGQA